MHDFPNPPRDQRTCDPRIPDYFNTQQDYVYKELEQQYYPAFLREKGFGNLTRPGVYGSLIAGLFCLWAGFVVAFTLVFYDYKPKVRRLGVSLTVWGARAREIEMTYLDLLSLPAHRPILLRFLLSLLRLLGARSAPGTPETIRSRILQDCEDSGRLYHAFACGQGGHLDGVCHPLYGHYDRHLVGCPRT